MSLLVLGTVALDDVKAPSGVKNNMLGGSAAHFSMGASLFTDVHLVGVVGRDFPEKYLSLLKHKGVNITSLKKHRGSSFHWKGEYKKEDFNTALTLATELGVLEDYVPEITISQKNIRNVFLANYDPDIQMQFLKLMNKPKFVGLDSMNLWIEHKKKSLLKLVKKVDLLVLNDGEARALTGQQNLVKAAKALRKLGPKLIVIKKGEHGVLFFCESFMFSFPAFPVEEVIDPTGAGDTFAGGIMGYLSCKKNIHKKTLKKAAVYATILSSFNVEGFGMSKTANLTLSDLNKRAKEFTEFISPVK